MTVRLPGANTSNQINELARERQVPDDMIGFLRDRKKNVNGTIFSLMYALRAAPK